MRHVFCGYPLAPLLYLLRRVLSSVSRRFVEKNRRILPPRNSPVITTMYRVCYPVSRFLLLFSPFATHPPLPIFFFFFCKILGVYFRSLPSASPRVRDMLSESVRHVMQFLRDIAELNAAPEVIRGT